MFTVALIGADGAGKTTIARMLLESSPIKMKYLYMNDSMPSSNIALPTARMAEYLKQVARQRASKNKKLVKFQAEPAPNASIRSTKRWDVFSLVRLLNRMADEYFRQIISWIYLLRGYIVLYDRHFIFEIAHKIDDRPHHWPVADRIHYWFLNNLYPKPNLVIFLDAPPEVLFSRKNEWPLEYLQKWSDIYLEHGKTYANFIRVDAAQPLDKVHEEVAYQVMQFYEANYFQISSSKGRRTQT